MEEIWKPVPSREGIIASSWGRILLPDREAQMPKGGIRRYIPKPTYGVKTKSNRTAQHVYMGISNRHFGNLKIHRLVCEAFHGPPPSESSVVIHKNEVGTDNREENIKWGTQKENLNAPGFIAYCKTRRGKNSPAIKGREKRIAV